MDGVRGVPSGVCGLCGQNPGQMRPQAESGRRAASHGARGIRRGSQGVNERSEPRERSGCDPPFRAHGQPNAMQKGHWTEPSVDERALPVQANMAHRHSVGQKGIPEVERRAPSRRALGALLPREFLGLMACHEGRCG